MSGCIHNCKTCKHWRAEVVDGFGRPMDGERLAYCDFHGTTTEFGDGCIHHSDNDEDGENGND